MKAEWSELKRCVSARRSLARFYGFVVACLLATLACSRGDGPLDYRHITPIAGSGPGTLEAVSAPPATATLVPASPPVAGLPPATPRPTMDVSLSPTPDHTRPSPLDRQTVEHYTIRRGDTLGEIGERFGVTAAQIAAANGLQVADTLFTGQVLLIPLPEGLVSDSRTTVGPALKILPDSEFVYGPGAVGFNLDGFIQSRRGYLTHYSEEVANAYLDGSPGATTLTGGEIVRFVAQRYSLNPRVLLAVLEYQAGWVTDPAPGDHTLVYPLRRVEAGREGLYRQLAWAANELNYGYYAWRAGALVSLGFPDGSIKIVAPGLNAGTVGLQRYFSRALNPADWTQTLAEGGEGFVKTYAALFGNPFALAWEPLVPLDLLQPELQLPFESGKVWAFTGGPHGAWADGSAWAALDFAPPAAAEGCTRSDEWVVAAAPGLIVRSEYGAVIEDLDGDGYEETGWALFYMHVEARERVAVGARVAAGDRLGHPSCEGGVANGTHVHFARKYNGEWIAADGPLPFLLDGWVSAGLGREYDGKLVKGEIELEACDCRADGNEISRP